MAQPHGYHNRSNEELAQLLYQRSGPPKPAPEREAPAQPPDAGPQPEPLASRRLSELGPERWPLSDRKLDLGPLSHRQERALFAGLSKATKANLNREPTVPEFLYLVEQVNKARAFVMSVERVMDGTDSVHVDNGRFVFGGSAQRRLQARNQVDAA